MRAAAATLRRLGAERLVAAIPVGAAQSCERLRGHVDELVCLIEPEDLIAISMWYDDFGQTTDAEVEDLLDEPVAEPLAR
jgi:predicted phosphoribosyltransferase